MHASDFFADLAQRYALSPKQEAARINRIRSAMTSGAFAENRSYNGPQMEAMSRRLGLTVYDFAVQGWVNWDETSTSHRQTWEDWAAKHGAWKAGDETPQRMILWRFPAYSGEWMVRGLAPPHMGPRAEPAPKAEPPARSAPTVPSVDDPLTGRRAGEDYHAAT